MVDQTVEQTVILDAMMVMWYHVVTIGETLDIHIFYVFILLPYGYLFYVYTTCIPQLLYEGNIPGILSEFNMWSMFYLCHCIGVSWLLGMINRW